MMTIPEEFYNIACSNRINTLCLPLFDLFGFSSVAYVRGTWDFKYIWLSSSKAISKYYHDNHLYQYQNGMPSFLTTTPQFLSDISQDTMYYKKCYLPLQEKFNLKNTVVINRHYFGYSEFLYISASDSMPDFKNTVLENLNSINRFLFHFKTQVKSEIKVLKKFSLNWLKLSKYNSYFDDCISAITSQSPEIALRKILNKDTDEFQIKRYYLAEPFENTWLTNTQMHVLYYLQKGFSFKVIANKMNLARITVRDVVGAIRKKFDNIPKDNLIELSLKYRFTENWLLDHEIIKGIPDSITYLNSWFDYYHKNADRMELKKIIEQN